METFIKEIGLIVEPNLKDEKNNKVAAKRMNGIMPTLKSWIQELGELRALKTAVCQELEISTQAYRDEILSRIPRGCNMETEIVHHFKNLFDIQDKDDVTESMNQIFLFVHECKTFLKSMTKVLDITGEVSLSAILLQIKQALSNK